MARGKSDNDIEFFKEIVIKNYEGKIFHYPQPTVKSAKKEADVNKQPIANSDICQMSA